MAKLDDDKAVPKRVAAAAPGRILAPMRQRLIKEAFDKHGFISVTDIAQDIGVSTMTIRRDLAWLEREGAITRTHGGAMAAGDAEELRFDRRMAENAEAKRAIARAAAALVGPRESVGLDVGTSILALAHELAGRHDLRVVTNNIRAAMALSGMGSPVYVLGGEVRAPEMSVIGSNAVQDVKAHFLDRFFAGISAIDENGLYDFSPEDAEVKRAFIESCGCVVVVCDASKFDRRALSRIAGLDAVDILVTDAPPPASLAAALGRAQARVVLAASLNDWTRQNE